MTAPKKPAPPRGAAKKGAKKPVGRPPIPDRQALIARICSTVAAGGLVKDACRDAGIDRSTLHAWTTAAPEFSNAYARAREDQAHAMAEEALRIADGSDDESLARLKAMADSVEDADPEDKDRMLAALMQSAIQRDRLRLDARKWLTSKIAPRVYGDKVTQEITGSEGGPLVVQVRIVREGRRVTAS